MTAMNQAKKDLFQHQSVMLEEVLSALNIQQDGKYIDATFGRGGHSLGILSKLGPKGALYVIDCDPEAILTANLLQEKDDRIHIWKGRFSSIYTYAKAENLIGKIKGVVFDLGVSSPQLDDESRGFSFKNEGPLDMRMDPSQGISAAEWINTAKETEIDFVFKTYGEERFHKRITRAIIAARAIKAFTSTAELAEVIRKAHPAWEKHKDPATRCFQAIRIFINDELNELTKALEQSLKVLTPEGRLVVISFHSLEDRIVKRFIQKEEKGQSFPPGFPIRGLPSNQTLKRVGRKIKPSLEEIALNKRARSAILRVAEKLKVNES